MQLIVLGMHRSGTSVLARLLNLMGAYFGPEGVGTSANQENPKGFWERRDVRQLNDMVLHSTGCDWNRIADFDLDKVPQQVLADFRKRAADIVLQMDAHRPWLLKEPRLMLLLPLWRPLFESPLCVRIWRNPLEVAASLQTRNQIPIEVGLALWEGYARRALAASADLPSVQVSHRQLMLDPAAEAGRLWRALEQHGVAGLRKPVAAEVEAFVSRKLYRERADRKDLAPFADAPQLRMFERIEAGGKPPRGAVLGRAEQHVLREYEAGLPPLPPPPAPKADGTARAVAELLVEVRARNQELASLAAQLQESGERFRVAEQARDREHAARVAAEDAVRRELTLARGKLEQLAADLATSERRGDALAEQLRTMTGQCEALAESLEERASRIEALERELARKQEEAETLRASLSTLESALAAAAAARDEDRVAAEAKLQSTLAAAAAALEEERTAAKATLERRDREAHWRQARIATLEAEAEALRAECREGERQLEDARRELGALRDWRTGAERELKANALAREGLEQDVEERIDEIVRLTRAVIDRDQRLAVSARELDAANQREAKASEALAEARAAGDRMAADAESLRKDLEATARALADVIGSSSWRATSFLRARWARLRHGRRVPPAPSIAAASLVRLSGLFDPRWYLEQNPDVAESGMDALAHYLAFGAEEGRDPGPGFDTRAYLAAHPEVKASGLNPLLHHVLVHGDSPA